MLGQENHSQCIHRHKACEVTWILLKTIVPNRKQVFIQLHGKKKINFSLLPKAETCFLIIADACFMIEFTNLKYLSWQLVYLNRCLHFREVDGQLLSVGT